MLLHVVMAIDASSNFLFSEPPLLVAFTRELLLVLLSLFAVHLFFKRLNIVVLVLSFFAFSFFVGLIYGFSYFHYLLRAALICIVFSVYYRSMKSVIVLSSLASLIYLFTMNILFEDVLHVNQGSRFFAANASVVSLLAIYLTVLTNRGHALFGYFSGLLTGSMSFFIYSALQVLRNIGVVIPIFVLAFILSQYFGESDSYRRLESFIDALASLDVRQLILSSTIGIRVEQFVEVLSNSAYSPLYGAPLFLTPSDSGVESQLLHIIAYGGLVGVLCSIIGCLFFAALFPALRKAPPIMLVVLLLYSLTFRWIESFFSVYFIALISFQLYDVRKMTFRRNHSL